MSVEDAAQQEARGWCLRVVLNNGCFFWVCSPVNVSWVPCHHSWELPFRPLHIRDRSWLRRYER